MALGHQSNENDTGELYQRHICYEYVSSPGEFCFVILVVVLVVIPYVIIHI